ncbi:hypothetical protein HYZ99_05560 [Candidatus Peregrinibacteria bacterium]|nr:hypothetical protein [Candidatus Peregrinibacteria bacterium]
MLSERVAKLVRDIYAKDDNEEVQQKLQEDPEEVLISLLETIKEDLPEVSSTLQFTVEKGTFGLIEGSSQRARFFGKKERAKK